MWDITLVSLKPFLVSVESLQSGFGFWFFEAEEADVTTGATGHVKFLFPFRWLFCERDKSRRGGFHVKSVTIFLRDISLEIYA